MGKKKQTDSILCYCELLPQYNDHWESICTACWVIKTQPWEYFFLYLTWMHVWWCVCVCVRVCMYVCMCVCPCMWGALSEDNWWNQFLHHHVGQRVQSLLSLLGTKHFYLPAEPSLWSLTLFVPSNKHILPFSLCCNSWPHLIIWW